MFSLFTESLKLAVKSAPWWAAANVLLSAVRSVAPLALLALVKMFIDTVSASVQTGTAAAGYGLTAIIAAMAAVYLADELSFDAGAWVRKNQSDRLEGFMYGRLHEKSVSLDLINFERPEYFNILSRASREAPWRPNSILNNIVLLLKGGVSLLLVAGMVFTVHWLLAAVLLTVNIPGVWLRLKYSAILYGVRREQTQEARRSAYFSWLLTGDRPSRELRLFGLGRYFMGLFDRSFAQQKKGEMNIIGRRTVIEMCSALFKTAAFVFILLFTARQTLAGVLSLGTMAMALLAFRHGMASIKELMAAVSGLYEDSLFVADAFEFLHLKDSICAAEPVAAVKDLENGIRVENMSFTYPGNAVKTLDGISFELKRGEVAAIVGPNGAGKSALVRLLCRLYDPDSGRITFDGTDIRHFDPLQYRKQFAVTFQDFMLYNLSLGENIRLGDVADDDGERIVRSADRAGLRSLIASLPEGLGTQIGNMFDGSRELSVGEWQKIALARSLYRQAPVIILDEPSSALDAEAEFELFSRFRSTVNGRTALLVSHRMASVSMADRIFVLDRGKITESGSHEELLNARGLYFDMYMKQAGAAQA
ncbi:MAG: ABC transporter ATP-binding protein/permease [Bacteroidales bacterium]|jgi:ATP-binding cassette subfamily B protein|nr:ABC transporter ATP-binding protein/permease [Bacteroidales bacterium]